jgi:hypothetical protein
MTVRNKRDNCCSYAAAKSTATIRSQLASKGYPQILLKSE